MDTSLPVRRIVATVTIASLSIAALMGILALVGSEFGDGEVRVLLTTLSVGVSSIAVLCYLGVAEGRYVALGLVGGLATVAALLTALTMIWGDADSDGTWQVFGVAAVVAASLAQACLLVSIGGHDQPLQALQAVTLGLVAVLAGMLCFLILGADVDDSIWRVIGIVAILDVLGTLVSMALGAVRRVAAPTAGAVRPPAATALPPALVDHLERHAQLTGRSVDDLIAEAVSDYLAAHSR